MLLNLMCLCSSSHGCRTDYFIVKYLAFYTKQNEDKSIFFKSIQEQLVTIVSISFRFYHLPQER